MRRCIGGLFLIALYCLILLLVDLQQTRFAVRMTIAPDLDAEPRRIIHGANQNWLATIKSLTKNTGTSLGQIEVSTGISIAVDRRWPRGRFRRRPCPSGFDARRGQKQPTSEFCRRR